ncbi:MAG: hypothetical protein ACI9VR_000714, partial [Cognaticolwellia sp.]
PPIARGDCESRVLPDLSLTGMQPPGTQPPGTQPPGTQPPGTLPQTARLGPKVTILICTYNRADLLPQAVASARAQGWPCEILVVNDGSQDGTQAWLETQDDLVVLHQENQGKPSALNAGIAACTGQALLVLDDDDMLLPGAIVLLAHALFSNPNLSCVFGDTIVFDGETGLPGDWKPATRLPPSHSVHGCLTLIPGMPGACLIRRSAQAQAGEYDPSMVRGQDMDMFLRLAQLGPFGSLPLATFLYRVHDGLRGSAADQWRKSDKATHQARFRSFVQPVFRRRMATASHKDSDLAHSWALGAHQRGLHEEAQNLLAKHPGPHTPRQAWIRGQAGLPSRAAQPSSALYVVHDGDPGSLQVLLGQRAESHDLWVDLQVPADPLGEVRLFWEGHYGSREQPALWVESSGPLHLALSSAPQWHTPALPSPAWLPEIPGHQALLVTAVAMGWPLPKRSRAGIPLNVGPMVKALINVQRTRRKGESKSAFLQLSELLKANGGWLAGWHLAAQLLEEMGLPQEAKACRAKAA